MNTVGIRELKNGLSRYLKRLKPGTVLTVTDRGRVVAEIHGVRPGGGETAPSRFDALVRAGIIRPAAGKGHPMADWPPDSVLKLPKGTAKRLIDEDRGGR